jgi:long-chain acyl-CoA synthetase
MKHINAFDYFFENTKHLEKPFLIGNENISFKKLYESSIFLANKIYAEIGQKQNIMLISANNLFFLKAYLAIIKSGNICIPIDPGIEKENFAYIHRITDPRLIFATKNISKKLPIDSLNCLYPDSDITLLANNQNITNDEYQKNENECAEIIFTSGSTGKPKGVMLSHKNLISNTSSIISYLNLSADDRMLVVLPFYYCYGLSLLHTHLRSGGSIVLNNSFIFLGRVIKDLLECNCTGFAGVPSHFQILLRKSESFKKTAFPALRYVTQAGGGLATTFIDEFRESFPNIKFYVMYGQTEATARLSYLPPEIYEHKKGSIGKGIPGVELKVINEQNEDINPGETGEIIARGDNIMIGYYPEAKCANKVLKNGWLYTGDLGTVDKEGYIYLTARKKEIIKIRGKRISPKEIESVIQELHEVIFCFIESVEDEILGEIIKATIVVNNQPTLNAEDIKRHCFNRLASFKVPNIIEFSNQFMVNSSGKQLLTKINK